jgi:hypothetical protein
MKNVGSTRNFLPVCLAIAAFLLLCSAALSAQESLMGRPPNVPADYVITPYGYFHPSCVHFVAEGNTLLPDGRIQHPDGAIDPASVCQYPHYTSKGQMVPLDNRRLSAARLPEINGWLEAVWVTTTSSYHKISATWPVPPAPKANDGQTLFFFPGFEDQNDVVSIVQPVLQWGPSAAGGGYYWAAASWNCCISNGSYVSPLIDVSSGDTMLGTITSNCKAGKSYCATWNIKSEDKTSGASTTLKKSPADGQTWNWAFGAVSEDYGVVQCSDFPNDSSLTFTVTLEGQRGKVISNPAWTGWETSDPSPQCSYGQEESATQETVEY